MDCWHFAKDAQVFIGAMVYLTEGNWYAGHAYPTNKEDDEPDIKNEQEVLDVILLPNAGVQPHTVLLKAGNTSVAGLAMV